MSDIAYKKRDIKKIKKQEKKSLIYKVFRKLGRNFFGFQENSIQKVLIYIDECTEEEYYNTLNKILFAFPYKKNLQIDIYLKEKLYYDKNNIYQLKYQRNYLKLNKGHIQIVHTYQKETYDLILVKNFYKIKNFLFDIHKTAIIDEYFFSVDESAVYQNYYYYMFTKEEQENFYKSSIENYKKFYKKNKYKNKSYVFVTGPSFDNYADFSYEQDSLKVICNSVVKNSSFLEYIGGPDILVFADPVFHFSSCEYSALFRDNVLDVVKKYKCYVMVPFKTVPLLLQHYPQLKNYIIGMKNSNDFNFPTLERFYTKGSANILTLYMLPIASAITNDIYILGADGRNPNEKYFWKHSSSAQYDDLMNTVFETHPSFFRDRDYKDYYEEHVGFLEKLIEFGEKNNKHYYSLTHSYIRCLEDRLC